MRTTVEISDAQRAALLKLAAERGEKGFSRLVGEALDRYLAEQGARGDLVRLALETEASLAPEAADALEESVRRIRSSWR